MNGSGDQSWPGFGKIAYFPLFFFQFILHLSPLVLGAPVFFFSPLVIDLRVLVKNLFQEQRK